MKGLNTKKSGTTTGSEEQAGTSGSKPMVLIVSGHPAVRQGLIAIVNRESDIMVCAEADGASGALDIIAGRQIGFAIISVCSGIPSSIQVAEEIRLQHPNLPVLILSVRDEALCAQWTPDEYASERITRAIRYIQSLLGNRVFGFSVLVKIERSA
jgi:DNA-binding NtrC family response regulator